MAFAGCESTPRQQVSSVLGSGTVEEDRAPAEPLAGPLGETTPEFVDRRGEADFYQPGTGRFVRPAAPAAPGTDEPGSFS